MTYLFDVATYLFSVLAVLTIRSVVPPESTDSPSLRSVVDGFRYALLGHVEAGLVAAAFSVPVSVVSGGVLCVLGVLLCGFLLPRFVGYDARVYNAASAAGAAKEIEHEEKADEKDRTVQGDPA